jgi:3-hydroxybutyryl-CoA dehydratase
MSEWPTTIVQEDINTYAEVSADFNPIHVDPEFARTTPYGTTIAHGCIVGAVVSRHLVERMGFENRVRSVRLKFIGPVRSGDSLQCAAEPDEDAAATASFRTYKVSCSNQKSETVAVGTAAIADEMRA